MRSTARESWSVKLGRGVLRGYRVVISPCIHTLAGSGFGCRFIPTCSEYASEAMQRYGIRKGVFLSARRMAKCHPWGPSGYDPVPDRTREFEI